MRRNLFDVCQQGRTNCLFYETDRRFLIEVMVRLCAFIVVGWLLIVSGCGRTPYEVAPVSGFVTIDNKPLYQGSIVFAPVAKGEDANAGKVASGRVQPDGKYRLSTYEENDGAIVGEHWVTIINLDEENLPEGVPEFARIRVPNKKVVESGKDNQIDISLTREEVRKYREDDR